MFKDLLVHIPTERSPRPAIDASVSLANECFGTSGCNCNRICFDERAVSCGKAAPSHRMVPAIRV